MGILVKNLPFQSNFNQSQAESAVDFYAKRDQREAELRARAPQMILEEKQMIDEAIARGRTLVANPVDRSFHIHRATCHTVRHQMDRDEAWKYWLEDPSGRSERYDMPNLVTPREVEALERYRACLVCGPDTVRHEKKPDSAIRPTALRNMAPRHLGRRFETIDGTHLGELVAYTMAASRVTLHFESGDHVDSPDAEVVMLPKPVAAEVPSVLPHVDESSMRFGHHKFQHRATVRATSASAPVDRIRRRIPRFELRVPSQPRC